MASLVQENWSCLIGDDGEFDEFDSLEIDGTLLMSLLDESHVEEEECDDERLFSVIQSLEAEIDPVVTEDHDTVGGEHELNVDGEDTQFLEGQYGDDQSCSISYDLDYNWMDMDDGSNLYYQGCGIGVDGMLEFGGDRDYSQITYGNTLEEQGFGALWQETNAQLM